jgi:hypothetical protein
MNPIITYIEERIKHLTESAENNPYLSGILMFSIEELQSVLNKIKEL